ncbi:hypothetical protein QN363_20365, partial [Undibacterium sp. CCC2.1]|nr:hypothetical protein [Undibacterium sp. CCC2.1]
MAEVDKTLKAWAAQSVRNQAPTPAQRRRLAALFLASDELASAYVQWRQLPEAERHVGDSLDTALIAKLRRMETVNNESYQLA